MSVHTQRRVHGRRQPLTAPEPGSGLLFLRLSCRHHGWTQSSGPGPQLQAAAGGSQLPVTGLVTRLGRRCAWATAMLGKTAADHSEHSPCGEDWRAGRHVHAHTTHTHTHTTDTRTTHRQALESWLSLGPWGSGGPRPAWVSFVTFESVKPREPWRPHRSRKP